MKNVVKIIFLVALLFISDWINASQNHKVEASFLSECLRPKASYDMKVNNVRARLLTGGDLFADAQYITPTNGVLSVSGIYAAGVWMGGVDRAKNVKLSAVSYRSLGFDYFTGPLDVNGTTESEICRQWDRIFTVKGSNIAQHIKNYKKSKEENYTLSCEDIPADVLTWPSQGNPYFRDEIGWSLPYQSLAGFWDMNDDGIYDPCDGDYPMIDDRGDCFGYHDGLLIPAEINYFIFNDNGGPHTLSGPFSLLMEFQVHAYAYSTSDELNDMSFYNYKLIQKANEDLLDCYFAWWVDPDMGCYIDDYIGCDPELGMSYIYNEDNLDDFPCSGTNSYGNDIPIIGFDYVKGPLVSKVFAKDVNGNFLLDNDGNKILKDPPACSGEQDTLIMGKMSSFSYMENSGVGSFPIPTTDPRRGKEDGFYNFLKGLWSDGTPMTYLGSAYNPGSVDTTKFAFPDPPNKLDGWSMCTAGLPNGDRRMIMSVGPMLLQPGSIRNLTMSVFTSFGVQYPCPDLTKLKYVNKIAQDLFENCTIDGIYDKPDAPEIKAIEKDREITLILDNPSYSNNYNEKFDSKIVGIPQSVDASYKFEGYKIYQVAGPHVRFDQLNEIQYARLLSQSDIKNDVADIYNWRLTLNSDTSPGAETYIWEKELKVTGNNEGIEKVFNFTEDQFASGDKKPINGKEYYFMAVAYAYNNWKDFDSNTAVGQKSPYVESDRLSKIYTFVPKRTFDPDLPQLKVTRISGEGNPHTFLLMEDDMHDKILSPGFDGKVTYKTGFGPLHGKVIDINKIQKGQIYRLEITGNFLTSTNGNSCHFSNDAVWKLTDITNNTVLLEDKPLGEIKEYVIDELGFAITVHQYPEPGNLLYEQNGGVGATITYKNSDGPKWFNAVKKGGVIKDGSTKIRMYDHVRDGLNQDPNSYLSQLGDGLFVPFFSSRFLNDEKLPFFLSPAARDIMGYMMANATSSLRIRDLNNVDIVLTSDKSKWSRCIVVESASSDYYTGTIGSTKNFELRDSPSIDENGNQIPNSKGMSYFPGYAIDVETGKRLNIFFGENSFFSGENANLLLDKNPIGGDMIFNPTSQAILDQFTIKNPLTGEIIGFSDVKGAVAGGQHYIYVTRMEYDGCTAFAERLKRQASGAGPSLANKAKVGAAITWTAFPILDPSMTLLSLADGLIPNDVVIRLRVNNLYGETRKFAIERERSCETDGDQPVYEFGFEDFEDLLNKTIDNIALEKVYVSPNPVYGQNGLSQLQLYNAPENATISIYDFKGQVHWISKSSSGDSQTLLGPGSTVTTYDLNGLILHPGIYFIQVRDQPSGKLKTLKWIVI